MDDERIIELFWLRSEDALTECKIKFGGYCRTIAKNILGNAEDADECINDTWFRAWNAIPPTRPTRLKSFLGKVTRNLALDKYEASHTQKRGGGMIEIALEELADIPIPETNDENITQVINGFLHSEPPESTDIFLMRYWYLHSIKEISFEYGYSESKITSLLFRMRKRLKEKLESEGLM
jgi:RNA polymerase sigma-70 factor (ECF subfamily)